MRWEELPDYARVLIGAAVGAILLTFACVILWLGARRHRRRRQAAEGYGTKPGGQTEVADIAPHRHLPKKNGSADKWRSDSGRSQTSFSSSGSEGYGSLKSVQQTSKKRVQKAGPHSQAPADEPPLDQVQFLQVTERIEVPGSRGSVRLSLGYAGADESLTVGPLSLRNLGARPLGGLPNAYVKVRLHRHGKEKPDFEYQTKTQQRSATPDFQQQFEAPVPGASLSAYTVRLVVCDHHRLGQPAIVGEAEIRLDGLDLEKSAEVVELELGPNKQKPFGEVLVSLSYLPTSERLYISVLRSNGFTYVHEPFVKVSLIFAGRNLQKRRVAASQLRHSLVFDEAVFFEVPRDKIGRVHVLLVAMETAERDVGGALDGAAEVGQLLLGRNCPYHAHAHWDAIMQMPRMQIAHWYPVHHAD